MYVGIYHERKKQTGQKFVVKSLPDSLDNRWKQNHYIEVAQGGVFSRARHNWLSIFSLLWAKKESKKKFKKNFYKREIMQPFSANATIFKRKIIKFCPWKH